MLSESGGQIGRYRILGTLGRGGFGTVYRAEDPELGRQVAIKVLHQHLAANNSFVVRFRAEARAAARLRHPHIVTIYDVGQTEVGSSYLVMELVEGTPLSRAIAQEAPFASERALEIIEQLAGALDYLHQQGVVHRDLKPANVTVRPDGSVTLMDFGIARTLDDQAHLTETGELVGTVAYMAPEQITGTNVGPAADIYSLGLLAYELFAGRPPFTGSASQVMDLQRFQPPPPLNSFNPSIPPAIAVAIEHALAKDPTQRPATAGSFVDLLNAGEPTQRIITTLPVRQAPSPGRRAPMPLIAAAVAAVILLGGLGLLVRSLAARGSSSAPAAQTARLPGSPSPLAQAARPPATSAAGAPAAVPASSTRVATRPGAVSAVNRTATGAPATSPGGGSGATLTVVKKYGAAMHRQSSSDAPVVETVACGTRLRVFDAASGWYQVEAANQVAGWVGGVRVADAQTAPPDCSGAVTFPVGSSVLSHVQSGCLSVRISPSRNATYAHCVSNGHAFKIINGPVEAEGDDWFGVTSADTGNGWVLAQFLEPPG